MKFIAANCQSVRAMKFIGQSETQAIVPSKIIKKIKVRKLSHPKSGSRVRKLPQISPALCILSLIELTEQ